MIKPTIYLNSTQTCCSNFLDKNDILAIFILFLMGINLGFLIRIIQILKKYKYGLIKQRKK